jgi:zona occludens toxin (predicted ATPase)
MSVFHYSGIPRSGKTYRMVYDLNQVKDKYFVIHNIDGLQKDFLGIYGIDFIEYCNNEKIEVTDFFSKEYQTNLTNAIREKYNRDCLIIIDEAQEWFDRNSKALKMWLSYHGHLNQTVWLVSHRVTNLSSVYRSYIELEYRAKHSSIISIPGCFMYNKICGGERIGYDFRRKKQEIFDIYKSQVADYVKPKKSLFLPVMILLIIAGVSYFFIIPQRVIGKGHVKENKISSELKNVNSQNQNDRQYRLIGCVGNTYIIEDKNHNVYKLSDLKNKYQEIMPVSENVSAIMLNDIENKRQIEINNLPWQETAATLEQAGSQPVKKK